MRITITIRCRTIVVSMVRTTVIALSIVVSIVAVATGSTSIRITTIVLAAALALLGELFLVTRFIVVVVRRGASKLVHHLRHGC